MKNTDNPKGGRPCKLAKQKRDHVATVKFTEAESKALHTRADYAGVKISEFLRHAAFRLTIVSRLTDEEREIARKIVAMFPDFNQAQTTFNTFKTRESMRKLEVVVDYLFTILKKLRPNKETDYVSKST